VVREFLGTFAMVLAGFVMLMLVFTFFELVGDILRNRIPLSTVGAYLVNLTPSMLYQIAPLAVLIAVLVTFGVLNRNSELIAMKATGISLYRLVVPVVTTPASLAVSSTTSSSIPIATNLRISPSSSSIQAPSRFRAGCLPPGFFGTKTQVPGASKMAGSATSRAPK
jgi:lipopolysaccharide export LptBFGC system permease protein LptF